MVADNSVRKQRGRPFPKGTSGNPAGKPPGIRNRATLAAEALLDGEADILTRKAVELALAGDTTALRLCMERVVAPRRARPICFALPKLSSVEDASKAISAIARAVANGEITTNEGAELCGLVEAFVRIAEVSDLEARLKALEEGGRKND